MKAVDCIKNNEYMVTEDGDITCFFESGESKGSFSIGLSSEGDLQSTMEVTKEIVYDSVHKTSSEFIDKYKDRFNTTSKLTPSQYFKTIRTYIVDEKVPIPKKKKKGIRSTKNRPNVVLSDDMKKLSRTDQVEHLLKQGITSPKEIANQLGTNSGYVSRLIKKVNEGSN